MKDPRPSSIIKQQATTIPPPPKQPIHRNSRNLWPNPRPRGSAPLTPTENKQISVNHYSSMV
ncbi:hypothetical protein, partial [Prosthecochloris ethylica]|uniref:hypothetical protein n=1 Tax=Prosthecochloris ethylica TaxID=2743976 RepID=UPI001A8E121A